VREGYGAQLALRHEQARAGDGSEAVFVGMLQVASPVALYRTAHSLVEMRPPTVREHLVQLPLARSLLVGARTVEAELPSGQVADWDYLALASSRADRSDPQLAGGRGAGAATTAVLVVDEAHLRRRPQSAQPAAVRP